MKLAVLSESPADQAAIRILVEGILDRETAKIVPRLASRGWPFVLDVLPNILRHLYYRTDADGLVIVVDSDDSPVHELSHEDPEKLDLRCRLCQLRQAVDRTMTELRSRAERAPLKTAIGVAVPAIEAWFLCGAGAPGSEAEWARTLGETGGGLREKRLALKREVYGTDRPSLRLETKRAIEESHRLIQHLPRLKKRFPAGFGALVQDLERW